MFQAHSRNDFATYNTIQPIFQFNPHFSPQLSCQRLALHNQRTFNKLMGAMTMIANLLLSIPFFLLSSSLLRAQRSAQSIEQWEMETGLAFWSWFNLAVTPIADGLKWLGRIVSAWWNLQLAHLHQMQQPSIPHSPPTLPNPAFSEFGVGWQPT